jgi:hypothetical protein
MSQMMARPIGWLYTLFLNTVHNTHKSYPIVNTVKLYPENHIFTGIYTTDAVYKTMQYYYLQWM